MSKPMTVIFRTLDGLEAVVEVEDSYGEPGVPRCVMRFIQPMTPDMAVRKYEFQNQFKNGLPVLVEVSDTGQA